MLRSLFTGISGLAAHQQMLDVTSNNIANVNTTGFKSSSSVFEDTLSQTLTGGGAPTATTGGANATQIGLGVKLAATNLNFTQGSNQATGVPSNMLINGDGFFVVQAASGQQYTRAGAFTLNSNGQLVTPDGAIVKGYLLNYDDDNNALTPDANGTNTWGLPGVTAGALAAGSTVAPSAGPGSQPRELNLKSLVDGSFVSYNIDNNGFINAVDATGNTHQIGQVAIASFTNPNGLVKVGNSDYSGSGSSGAALIGSPNLGGNGSITSGYVEMSNVNLAQELTNLIISQRGFQANSKVITTSDEVLQTLVNLKQ